MTVEVAVLISIISVAFGVYQGVTNLNRNKKHDDKEEASQMTTVIVKLESIGTGITKIETKMNSFETEIKDHGEKIIRLEESLKSAWKRISVIEGNQKGDVSE